MEFISQAHHPNGLKIALALTLTGKQARHTIAKVVQDGAVLRVAEPTTGAMMALSANSAVLYLFSAAAGTEDLLADRDTEAWLGWEANKLQRSVGQHLQSGTADRSHNTEQLSSVLCRLTDYFRVHQQTFLAGKSLGASDVVVAATLLPLTAQPSSSTVLPARLTQYLADVTLDQRVKAVFQSWHGSDSSWPCASSAAAAPAQDLAAALQKKATITQSAAVPVAEQSPSVHPDEIAAAQRGWGTGPSAVLRTKTVITPVLPVAGERNILITSALPYVNNVPHLGNIIGCVLSADCFARYCRLREDNVVYICGTDEYGTATETKAIEEKVTPQQICDKYHKLHASVYKSFNINFDSFGRTTTPSQTEIVHELFWDLEKNGNISRECVEQLYCEHCSRFLADRFVEGTCPHLGCGYEDARGDQCDGCGKLVNAADLAMPRCKLCSATPKIKSSNHLFIDLPKIEPELKEWFYESSKNWTHTAGTICNAWLRDGLLPRCITRDLKWGVPVPLKDYDDKVFYVWFDAPVGYISITKDYTKDWKLWWKNPEQVQLYQFMAKDNVPFHGIIFPCMLTGAHKSWTRVTNLIATEYLNYEDEKFSKSRGVGVFGDQAVDTGIPSDVWRFYLLYIRPESQDTAFSWTDLQAKNNTELLNNLGNFVNRSLKFVSQFYGGVIPNAPLTDAEYTFIASVNQHITRYTNCLNNVRLRDGLRHILALTKLGNQYIQDNEPYKLIKPGRPQEDKEKGARVITVAANIVYFVALMLNPYMPDTCAKILGFLNKPPASETRLPTVFVEAVVAGDKVTQPEPLIKKITDEDIAMWREKFKGKSSPTKGTESAAAAPAAAPAPDATISASPADVDRLQKLVTEQGEKVRSLKAAGAGKADITTEVTALLALKQQLVQAQGVAPVAGKSKNNKKGTQAPAPPVAAAPAAAPATAAVDTVEVDRLTALVSEQGIKVRDLKSSGASKDQVTEEVKKLLQLKTQLATASGVDPATIGSKGKSKKKK